MSENPLSPFSSLASCAKPAIQLAPPDINFRRRMVKLHWANTKHMNENESFSPPASATWPENPKSVFKRLPRPARTEGHKGEDPKQFLRRMAVLSRLQQLNPPPIGH